MNMKNQPKYVSYLRVSTDKQGIRGLGIEAQREAVRRWLVSKGDRMTVGESMLVAELVEVESGRRKDRPKLAEALRLCKLYNATLLVAKLDRLSRNLHFISTMMESGVEFRACDFPEANRLMLHLLAAVAEHEARMISERTKNALAQARARGTKLGTRDHEHIKRHAEKGRLAARKAVQERVGRRAEVLAPKIAELRSQGVTGQRAIARRLNEDGVPAARGQWSAPSVARLLAALDAAA